MAWKTIETPLDAGYRCLQVLAEFASAAKRVEQLRVIERPFAKAS